jgi:hypothetical protein
VVRGKKKERKEERISSRELGSEKRKKETFLNFEKEVPEV